MGKGNLKLSRGYCFFYAISLSYSAILLEFYFSS